MIISFKSQPIFAMWINTAASSIRCVKKREYKDEMKSTNVTREYLELWVISSKIICTDGV